MSTSPLSPPAPVAAGRAPPLRDSWPYAVRDDRERGTEDAIAVGGAGDRLARLRPWAS
ncbi:hypothetical protein [Streptomyces levis]|uniref:hypothetical protein n=1 Tax=Streptomyces levis TaxID=285566 RepID=UPI0031E08414